MGAFSEREGGDLGGEESINLKRTVRQAGYFSELQILRTLIGRLRRKIEYDAANPTFILTEPGVGYWLRARHICVSFGRVCSEIVITLLQICPHSLRLRDAGLFIM